MSKTTNVTLACAAAAVLAALASPAAVKAANTGNVVACVGDSITAGYSLAGNQAYPVQLNAMLGGSYAVYNYGVSGTTLLKNGNYSYWGTSAYRNSQHSRANFVIIQLGTNDSKPGNWNPYGSQFPGDYASLISSYTSMSTHPKVFVCYIPPYFLPNPWPTDFPDPARIPNLLIPAIQQVVNTTGQPSIDNYTPFVNQPALFNDGIHPTVDGANIIALNAYNAITGAGVAVLTGANINDGSGPNGGNTANAATAAFDHNSNSYYYAAQATGAWTGIDLGSTNTKTVKMICYTPRTGSETSMVGGVFQGSNDLANWSNLAPTITSAPADTYQVIPVSNAPVYRYLRYLSAGANSYGNVAEVEFIGK